VVGDGDTDLVFVPDFCSTLRTVRDLVAGSGIGSPTAAAMS
jgi:hypothetical protein